MLPFRWEIGRETTARRPLKKAAVGLPPLQTRRGDSPFRRRNPPRSDQACALTHLRKAGRRRDISPQSCAATRPHFAVKVERPGAQVLSIRRVDSRARSGGERWVSVRRYLWRRARRVGGPMQSVAAVQYASSCGQRILSGRNFMRRALSLNRSLDRLRDATVAFEPRASIWKPR
jgi:hypothetical protein